MKLYAGNLAYEISGEDLRTAFSVYGKVESAEIVTDLHTKQSKGFGFVEMPERQAAEKAINELHGTDFKGRQMNVNEARPRAEKGGRGQGGGWKSQGRLF